jgi:hypothetical protein
MPRPNSAPNAEDDQIDDQQTDDHDDRINDSLAFRRFHQRHDTGVQQIDAGEAEDAENA